MIVIELTIEELAVIVNSLGSASPVEKSLEITQFKLYHRLLFMLKAKYNENV